MGVSVILDKRDINFVKCNSLHFCILHCSVVNYLPYEVMEVINSPLTLIFGQRRRNCQILDTTAILGRGAEFVQSSWCWGISDLALSLDGWD